MLRNRGSRASNTFDAYGEDLAVARSSEHLWDLVERPSRDLSLRSPVYLKVLTDCLMGRAGYAMRFWWALHRSKWCAGVQGCQPLCGYIIEKSVWMLLSFDVVIFGEEAYLIAQLMYSLMYIENFLCCSCCSPPEIKFFLGALRRNTDYGISIILGVTRQRQPSLPEYSVRRRVMDKSIATRDFGIHEGISGV